MGPRTPIYRLAADAEVMTRPAQTFYVLNETPCPYLPERRERKLITELRGGDAAETFSQLSRAGFRRSHGFAYRPACHGCAACVPVRVLAGRFRPSRSFQRILRLNRDVRAFECPPQVSHEQFAVFDRYIEARHGDGEMAGMTFRDYRAMVEETRLDTCVAEFRSGDGQLIGACLADWLEDGPSAVYSFFDPAFARQSPGTYMILWLIEEARRRDLPHVYLGYWIAGSRKMAYKARFQPVQGLGRDGWRPLPAINGATADGAAAERAPITDVLGRERPAARAAIRTAPANRPAPTP
jgi:arginine-tRNA-protein transferase